MSRVSQRSVARYGTPIRCGVKPEVAQALLSESKRCKRSVSHIASLVLEHWMLDVWIPAQQTKK